MELNITTKTTTFKNIFNRTQLIEVLKSRHLSPSCTELNFGGIIIEPTAKACTKLVNASHVSFKNKGSVFIYNRDLVAIAEEQVFLKLQYEANQEIEKQMNEASAPAAEDFVCCGAGKQGVTFEDIRQWAQDKGIYDSGDLKTQTLKLVEESGELAQAVLNNDLPEIEDAIGDAVVVLTSIAHLAGLKIEDCMQAAYDVITKRTGKMVDGTFVKD
jgi:NTP pyrophosphatase (non-canonical NTP hydrolase)